MARHRRHRHRRHRPHRRRQIHRHIHRQVHPQGYRRRCQDQRRRHRQDHRRRYRQGHRHCRRYRPVHRRRHLQGHPQRSSTGSEQFGASHQIDNRLVLRIWEKRRAGVHEFRSRATTSTGIPLSSNRVCRHLRDHLSPFSIQLDIGKDFFQKTDWRAIACPVTLFVRRRFCIERILPLCRPLLSGNFWDKSIASSLPISWHATVSRVSPL
mmetsp:Transcript_31102/g.60888  ORF Transcript_31102/g.60888 Transcript_31102/m.60888 type:complete len:210 (+) Transcript_31102:169-798(+)